MAQKYFWLVFLLPSLKFRNPMDVQKPLIKNKIIETFSEEEPTWTSWGYWLKFYRHRVVRLYPAYLYTLLAVTLRISVTHFHPMWPPTDPAIQCPKYWWQNVLFVNSILDNQCMPWTWYIGTEFIYYLLSPIFLLTLRKAPKIGFVSFLFLQKISFQALIVCFVKLDY